MDLLVLQHYTYTGNINKIFLEMDLLYSTILVTYYVNRIFLEMDLLYSTILVT